MRLVKMRLADEAQEFVGERPIDLENDDEIDERVQGFLIRIKSQGDDLAAYEEEEWRRALEVLGVNDADLPSYIEDIAGWRSI